MTEKTLGTLGIEFEERVARAVDVAMRLPMDMSRVILMCLEYEISKEKAVDLFSKSWDQVEAGAKEVRRQIMLGIPPGSSQKDG
jgi:hypothetical protein